MGDRGASEFGKEHGLVHEAIVTGRKVGAGLGFWSRLAHDEAFFREVFSVYESQSRVVVSQQPSPLVSYSSALEIFGADLIGLEAVNTVYCLNLKGVNLPPINCSATQLKRFQTQGFQLILQIDKMKDGSPLTIRRINELAEGKTFDGNKLLYASDGRLIKSDAWYKSEPFLDESLKLSWRISSKQVIEGTLGRNYLDQTEVLISYLKQVFNGNLPPRYEEAVKAFEMKKAKIAELLKTGDWIKAGDVLQSLSITGMIRELIPNFIYRLHLTEKTTGEKFFPNIYIWTASRGSDGGFVDGGSFDLGGVSVSSDWPDCVWGGIGASLSLEL